MKQLADPEQTSNRTEILNQFFRGMLLLNGAACLGLLAFVQTTWADMSTSFVRLAVVSASLFLAGLVFTAVGQFARYQISLKLQFGPEHSGRRWRRAYFWLVALSVVGFIVGAGLILVGLYFGRFTMQEARSEELEQVAERCVSFGFAPDTEAHANCQMRLTEAILGK